MITHGRLHRLIDDLSDESATEILASPESQLGEESEHPAQLPGFFGMLHSGKGNLAAYPDEILRAELGRR